jgi:hypothetical protein
MRMGSGVKTLLLSQVVTAAGNSGKIDLAAGIAVLAVYVNVTAFTGTSITFGIDLVDDATGNIVKANVLSTAALVATGEVALFIGETLTNVANLQQNTPVPLAIRINWSGTITSVTFVVNAEW